MNRPQSQVIPVEEKDVVKAINEIVTQTNGEIAGVSDSGFELKRKFLERRVASGQAEQTELDNFIYTGEFSTYKIELEARINFNSASQFYYWNTLKEAMIKRGVPYTEEHITTVTFGNFLIRAREVTNPLDADNSTIRFIEDKIPGLVVKLDEPYWITYHVSLEKIVSDTTKDITLEKLILKTLPRAVLKGERSDRRMIRYSFKWSGLYRLDLTQATTGDITTFEIELEQLDPNVDPKVLVRYARLLSKMARGSLFPYSQPEQANLAKLVNYNLQFNTEPADRATAFHIDKNIFNEVKILTTDAMRYGQIVGGKIKYSACHKSDGYRTIMIISHYGIWFVYPPVIYDLVMPDSGKIFGVNVAELTVLDGEIVPLDKRIPGRYGLSTKQYWYHVFDCLTISGRKTRYVESHVRRLVDAKDYIANLVQHPYFPRDLIDFTFKTQYGLTLENFFTVMQSMVEEQKVLPYKTDGFIFTPANYRYSTRRQPDETYTPQVLKWKSPEETTIDFRVKKDPLGLYVAVYDVPPVTPKTIRQQPEAVEVLFEGTERYKFDSSLMINTESLTDIPTGVIVEMKFTNGQFSAVRFREDKHNPNSMEAASSNWENIMSPLTLETLTGGGFELMRRYHSRAKADLLVDKSGNPLRGILLDLGAGRGGGLPGQSRFSVIICVEINPKHIESLVTRAQFYKRRVMFDGEDVKDTNGNYIVIVQASVTETERIWNVVRRHSSIGVNAVSLMDVGTFIWRPSPYFDDTMRTIRQCLAPGGIFVWKMMDGRSVRKKIESLSPSDNTLKIGSFELHFTRTETGIDDQVTVVLPGSILDIIEGEGGQKEYLTNPSDMYTLKYEGEDYEMVKVNEDRLLGERLLGTDGRELSDLYSVGTMEKIVTGRLQYDIREEQMSPTIVRPLQRPQVRTPSPAIPRRSVVGTRRVMHSPTLRGRGK